MALDVKFIERFIRQEAVKRRMDPDIAVRVARSEGLGPNIWQSNIRNEKGERERSWGPFQLNDRGLGAKFARIYGKPASDPSTVLDQIRFSLDEAQTGGWTPWHGWKGDRWAGIKQGYTGGRSGAGYMPVTGPQSATDYAMQNARAAARPGEEGGPALVTQPEAEPASSTAPGVIEGLLGSELTGKDKDKPLGGLLADMMKPPEMAAPPNVLPQGGGASGVQSLPEYIQQFLAAQMRGRPPTGGQGFG